MLSKFHIAKTPHRKRWRHTSCGSCGGHGVVSDFRSGDFDGAMDCDACGGKGFLWISPKDRLADYPGGPLRGSAPGLYKEAGMKRKTG